MCCYCLGRPIRVSPFLFPFKEPHPNGQVVIISVHREAFSRLCSSLVHATGIQLLAKGSYRACTQADFQMVSDVPLCAHRTPESLHMHNTTARLNQIISQLNGKRQISVFVPDTRVLYQEQRAEAVRKAAHFIHRCRYFFLPCEFFLFSHILCLPLTHLYFILSLQQ